MNLKQSAPSIIHWSGSRHILLVVLWLAPVLMGGPGRAIAQTPELDYPSLLDFGSVETSQIVYRDILVTNISPDPVAIDPEIDGVEYYFSLSTGGGPYTLAPGETRAVIIAFRPSRWVLYQTDMYLTPGLPPVVLQGRGSSYVANSQYSAPERVDFGQLRVGQSADFVVTVYNTGTYSIYLNPSLTNDSSNFSIIAGGEARSIYRYQSSSVTVRFTPSVLGDRDCFLRLGTNMLDVALVGRGLVAEGYWSVTPSPVEVPITPAGQSNEMAILLCNSGTTELACAPTIDGHNQGFSIVTGAEPEPLLPNDCREILVRFEPAHEGYFPARLVLGQGLPALPFIGSTGAIADSCGVDETVLRFGSIEANQTVSRPVRIANTSAQVIRIYPQSDSPRFVVNGFIGDLLPGDTATIYVVFSPEGEGDWTGTISTGHPMCSQIECSGDSYRIPNAAPDRLGIYFNGSFTENEIESAAGGIVEAAIVLINPSAETGVLGWECTVGIEGEAMMLDWNLEGDALNIAGAPEFIVGLMRAPLPYAQAIRLATFRVLVLADETPSFLSVGPTSVPSIAGRMAWAPRDFANLIPLHSVTGVPVVAAINGAVAADIPPAPGIAYANSLVHLHWLVPEAVGSAFRIYRREGDSEPELLTQAPVPVSDGVASYTDRPTGYAAGTRLYYSYATVQAGLESARSDEALFTVDDTPVLVTRLLPSFPNPFNPQTKIRFEIARAGRVQVAIYDLSGRLVKTLVDGHLEVGSDTRIWQGRDNDGRAVASGSYFVRLSTEAKVDHQKVMLLK